MGHPYLNLPCTRGHSFRFHRTFRTIYRGLATSALSLLIWRRQIRSGLLIAIEHGCRLLRARPSGRVWHVAAMRSFFADGTSKVSEASNSLHLQCSLYLFSRLEKIIGALGTFCIDPFLQYEAASHAQARRDADFDRFKRPIRSPRIQYGLSSSPFAISASGGS